MPSNNEVSPFLLKDRLRLYELYPPSASGDNFPVVSAAVSLPHSSESAQAHKSLPTSFGPPRLIQPSPRVKQSVQARVLGHPEDDVLGASAQPSTFDRVDVERAASAASEGNGAVAQHAAFPPPRRVKTAAGGPRPSPMSLQTGRSGASEDSWVKAADRPPPS